MRNSRFTLPSESELELLSAATVRVLVARVEAGKDTFLSVIEELFPLAPVAVKTWRVDYVKSQSQSVTVGHSHHVSTAN